DRAVANREHLGTGARDVKQGFVHMLEAAFALGDRDKVDDLCSIVEGVPAGLRPPLLAAIARRYRARLAGDDPSADADYAAAEDAMRRLELPFHLAVVQLEHAQWLVGQSREDESQPLLAEARGTFERLRATPWLER